MAARKSLQESVDAALDLLPADGSSVLHSTWYDQVMGLNDANGRDAIARITKLQLADMKLVGGQFDADGKRVKVVLHVNRKVS